MTRWYAPAFEDRLGNIVVDEDAVTRYVDFVDKLVETINGLDASARYDRRYFVAVMDKPEWKRL